MKRPFLFAIAILSAGSSSSELAAQTPIYRSRATAIRFSRNGDELLSAGAIANSRGEPTDKRLRVWNVKSGREIWRLPAQPIDSYDYVNGRLNDRTLLMPGFDLMLSALSGWVVKPIHIHSARFEPSIEINNGLIGSLALSPDEKILAIGVTRAVELRDARTFELLRTYRHEGQGTRVQFGPDGKTVICRWDFWDSGKPQAFAVATAKQIRYPRWFYRVRGADAFAFSPDGKRLAKANGQTIEIWTTPNLSAAGRKLKTILPVVLTLQFSPDGQTLAVGGLSKSLKPVEFFAVTAS